VVGFFRLADQLIDGFAGKQLARQGSSPRPDGKAFSEKDTEFCSGEEREKAALSPQPSAISLFVLGQAYCARPVELTLKADAEG
jgi:hypothetical protein